MIVTLASLLPRTGRPARSMRDAGSTVISNFSRCASVFLSFESRNSRGVVRVAVFKDTGSVSKPVMSLALTSPIVISTDGGILNCERSWFSILRLSGMSADGAGVCAEHPVTSSSDRRQGRSDNNVNTSKIRADTEDYLMRERGQE